MTAPMIGGAVLVILLTAGSAAAAVTEVHLKDQRFNPKSVIAKPGDMIVFYNDDRELHSVFLNGGETLLTGQLIDPNASYKAVIPATANPATYDLVCTIHIDMKATLQIIAQ
jgi:plastocyanin